MHSSQITNMVVSPDRRLLFTTGADGAVFIFQISEKVFNEKDLSLKASLTADFDGALDKKGNKDARTKIVDPELADIVFVYKNLMQEWKKSQNQLRYQLALTKKRIEIKIQDQKRKFRLQY